MPDFLLAIDWTQVLPFIAIGFAAQVVDGALDEATGIARLPSNGIRIAGPRHDLTIFAQ